MPGQNPEEGGPSEKEVMSSSEEDKKEKISHGEKARQEEEKHWLESTAGELLSSLEEQQGEDYNAAEALGMDLKATIPLSRERKNEVISKIKEISEKTRERHQRIVQLMEMKHLREMAAYHLSSIGDWMETAAKIGEVDFNYDNSQPLLRQLDKLKESLPSNVYKLLEAQAGEKWQAFEDACRQHNKIVSALKKESDVLTADKLEKIGFFDIETKH